MNRALLAVLAAGLALAACRPADAGTAARRRAPRAAETDRGRAWDIGGRNFERFVVRLLGDPENLAAWKAGQGGTNFTHACFRATMECLRLKPGDVRSIAATSRREDIGTLPGGGSPKTDVIATVRCADGRERLFTFSCKRSTKSYVSVHQYPADAFADVLDRRDDRLRALLRTFQAHGNTRDMPKEDVRALESRLKDHVPALCRWVVGGHGGEGSRRQLADYVVTYRADAQRFSVHATEDYIRLMMSSPKGTFGTPFKWTFASGQRGKSIQLKMPVL